MVPATPAAISMPPNEKVVTTTRGHVAMRPMTTVPKTKPARPPKTMTAASAGSLGQPMTLNWLERSAAIHQYR